MKTLTPEQVKAFCERMGFRYYCGTDAWSNTHASAGRYRNARTIEIAFFRYGRTEREAANNLYRTMTREIKRLAERWEEENHERP